MELKDASTSDEAGHPRKRQKKGDEGDRPSKHQALRNGIIASDRADIKLRDQFFNCFINNASATDHHQHGIPQVGDSATSSSEALIESLSFPTMDGRRDNISEECPHTCEWLLETNEWKQWRQSFEVAYCPRLLWIKGHAGSGKSTIMKYAYEHALRSKTHGNEIVLAHFFNARAKGKLDKSTEGMYRTILVQLLEELPATYTPGDVARRALRGQVNWDVEHLLGLFREILRAQADRPVTCFVDALDECDEDQTRDMIVKFRDLMEKESKGVRVQIRVFFSSRNYPTILTPPPDQAICIGLENQPGHAQDITNYIESYLLVHDSPIAREVKVGVQKKARGSFVWCKLVIDLLNKDNADARLDGTLYLRERLAAMPPELDVLFARILGMNGEDHVCDPETILCTQWVLFSMRDLTPQELWWAIRRGIESWTTKSTELAAMCQPEYLKRYILWASRGLVEIVKDKDGRPIVQVIHESVRDFLLGQGKMAKLMGLETREKEALARSHEQMKRICWDELFVHAAHISTPKLTEELPLLPYAAKQMVKHANAALRCNVTSTHKQQFLDDLERRREQFNKLRIASHTHFGCRDATLTEILLHENAEALIEPQYRRLDAAGAATHRFGLEAGFGVGRALQERSCSEAVKAVIDVHLRRHPLGDPRRDLLLTIAPKPPFDGYFRAHNFRDPLLDLADTKPDLGVFFLMAALPVTNAATKLLATQPKGILGNFNALLSFVLANPLQFEKFQDSLDLEEALRWAASAGDVVMAQILLDKSQVDINTSSSRGRTPLHYAARKGHETMVDFLLARDGIKPDACDINNETPLYYACSFPIVSFGPTENKAIARRGIVRSLLATGGAGVNVQSNHRGQTPLHAAVGWEAVRLVEVLLADPEIDANAFNSVFESPLHKAVSSGKVFIVRKLLDATKVNSNARNSRKESPLDLAVKYRSADIVQALLAAPRLDVNAADSLGLTSLHKAISSRRRDNVKRLLDAANIDVNARTSWENTPLHLAVLRGSVEIVQELLAAPGVDVNARNRNGQTVLHIISAENGGNQYIAKMLLDTGKVDVNSQTKDGKTPHDLASEWQHKDIAKLLADYDSG